MNIFIFFIQYNRSKDATNLKMLHIIFVFAVKITNSIM